MSRAIDVVYDRLVAEEKLKDGTKYERLAAIAFRSITKEETVHDLRLVGTSGVAHQIDAVVGAGRKRVLIEAKDYDKAVGLGIARDFWGVVEDVRPSEAYIVTTERFTKPAIKFALAKGITPALLRPPRDEDWGNILRRIVLRITTTEQTAPPAVTWELHPDDHDKITDATLARGLTAIHDIELSDQLGQRRLFFPLLDQELREDYAKIPLGGAGKIGRLNRFADPTWLHSPGLAALRVTAWKWEVDVASREQEVVTAAVGGLAAELVLRTVDGSIHQMFTADQIEAWSFDGHKVVPRSDD
jgi:hypothetical protein